MTAHPEEFTPPPAAGATGDAMEAYARVWRRVQPALELHAAMLGNDRDERDEVLQAARVELWRLDPSRCDVSNVEDVKYLRMMLKHEMSRVAASSFGGRERRSRTVPLDLVRELRPLERDLEEE